MHQSGVLPLLLLCVASPSAAHADEDYVIVEGDIQVPRGEGRDVDVLSASPLTRHSQLFPLGHVRYYIETEAVNGEGLTPMDADDVRVAAAVADWEAKTCIRFTKYATAAECGLPCIKFITGTGCSSSVGASSSRVNTINLKASCSTGTTIHEIGHSLGLLHEQMRKDRDEYVIVDVSRVRSGYESNFNSMSSSGRDVGAYDYNSIMHYSATTFSNGEGPTIIAPQPIGQRVSVSTGDVSAIQFMYNQCSADYVRPQCMASIDTTQTHLIPHSKPWNLDFNVMYDAAKSTTVSYEGTTAPAGQIVYSRASGSSAGNMGFTELTFTPSAAVGGQTFTLSATFTGSDGPAMTCAVTVLVAAADTVCFGLEGSDPNVCGGHGTCVADLLKPCDCDAGYAGTECTGTVQCPDDALHSFDGEMSWSTSGDVSEDSSVFVSGGASMRVGAVGSATRSQAWLYLAEESEPHTVTYNLRAMGGPQEAPAVYFRKDSDTCAIVQRYTDGRWRVGNSLISGTAPETDRWYEVTMNFDWTSREYSVYIDGAFLAAKPIDCVGAVNKVIFFGNGYLDEFKLWCTDAGRTLAPGVTAMPTSVPVPPTSAPATDAPAPVPETDAPPTATPKSGTLLSVPVQNGNDDWEERPADGSRRTTSSDLELAYDSQEQVIGIRWANVHIPAGAVITEASIEFTADERGAGSPTLLVGVENTADAAAWSSSALPSQRSVVGSVAWTPGPWVVQEKYSTPQLVASVQSVVSKAGWAAGNAIAAVVRSSGAASAADVRVAESFEGNGVGAVLVVRFEVGVASTNAPATSAPPTDAPATKAPRTSAPATRTPSTDSPATSTPATITPATDAPAPVPETDAPPTATPKHGTLLSVPVQNGNDDWEERPADGSRRTTSSDLELAYDSQEQVIGIRWANVHIPAGAVITEASIEFTADERGAGSPTLLVGVENTADAAAWSSSALPSQRSVVGSVAWTPGPWVVQEKYSTPQLVASVQSVVSKAGWAAGNAIAAVVRSSGAASAADVRVAESFEGNGVGAVLVVRFEVGAASTNAPDTSAPATSAPATRTPSTDAPATSSPATSTPVLPPLPGTTPGMQVSLYKASSKLTDFPDFNALMPQFRAVTERVNYRNRHWRAIDDSLRNDFAATLTGFLDVKVAGEYTLHLTSDDGSRLWLDNEKKIENGGVHTKHTESATLTLSVGAHPLTIHFFERNRKAILDFQWTLPSGVREFVPGANMHH